MAGKKVYFYNTSINGMLSDTKRFLLKMEYVFKCFRGRKDACLLWRPHPLMETTFLSMRKGYKPFYDELKRTFIQEHLGIYDDTPDIEKTIALCDAYVGDAGTSVTSMFGIAGKPVFILNNLINTLPEADDWRGGIINGFFFDGPDEWMVTQGNKLYHSPDCDYHYEFYCDLSEYTSGDYYLRAVEMNGRIYVCPANAQDILVVSDHKIIEKIALKRYTGQRGAFCNAWRIGRYLFLIPFKYPAIVRYDTENGGVDYITGYNDIFIKHAQGEWRIGGSCVWKGRLLLASPADDKVLVIDSAGMEARVLTTGSASGCGCIGMITYAGGICMLPYAGITVGCWNPDTGELTEYTDIPEGFQCKDRLSGLPSSEHPFGYPAVYQNEIVLPPVCGNMFLSIDMGAGTIQEWEPPFTVSWEGRNGYFPVGMVGVFLRRTDTLGKGTYRFFYEPERKLYDINIRTKEFKEIGIMFDLDELLGHEPGFGRNSDWFKYGCVENALYSLKDFLDGTDKGHPFNREEQLKAYREIAENSDGTCGKRIHAFACANV